MIKKGRKQNQHSIPLTRKIIYQLEEMSKKKIMKIVCSLKDKLQSVFILFLSEVLLIDDANNSFPLSEGEYTN